MNELDGANWMGRIVGKLRRMTSMGTTPAPASAERLVAEPWLIDEVTHELGKVEVYGWALPDPGAAQGGEAGRFLVNGAAPSKVVYPIDRPGVQEVFWQRPNATPCGYRLWADEAYPEGVMKITCLDSAAIGAESGRQNWYIPDPALHADLPDAERRFRVIGNRDPQGFLLWGATDALRIRDAYEATTHKKWDDLTAVLDWGVGCGRVARHLAPKLGNRFFGCDIDADNIKWCKEHLPGSYSPSRLEPRLPFDSNSFDVIYGVSVFTHLRSRWEKAWLAELHRVLRPGGTMLVTVHGQTAIDFAGLKPADYHLLMDRVSKEGLVVTSDNNQLDGFVEHPEEYVNVFHSEKRIQTTWGRWFKDIHQLKGYIFTHDLVVATKK